MNESMNASVASTRIRLARNVKGMPFPRKMNASQAREISRKVYETLGSGYKLYDIKRLGETEAGALVEKHLISKELLACGCGSVAVSDDETISVMLNEEDHIREQVILAGLKPDEAYTLADALDDRIGEKVEFAFDGRLGYLTACPTNLGTGMRASVMLFLPALTITDALASAAGQLGMYNITLRGVYGEGSDALGFMYQVSNQRTLGVTEREILELVRAAVKHILDAEERARDFLMATRGPEVKDEIMRAYGVAANAYKLSGDELIKYLSFIKLGAYYGLLDVKRIAKLDELETAMLPYGLVSSSDVPLADADERDVYRAAYVRETLKGLVSPCALK